MSLKWVESALQAAKPGDRQTADRRLGAAGDHHVGIAELDQAAGVADGVGAGRAGGDHGMVGAAQLVADRDLAGGEIDQAAGNEERADPARAAVAQRDRRLVDALQAADARADQNAGGDLVVVGFGMPAGVVEGLVGGRHRVDDERIDLADFLRLHPLFGS